MLINSTVHWANGRGHTWALVSCNALQGKHSGWSPWCPSCDPPTDNLWQIDEWNLRSARKGERSLSAYWEPVIGDACSSHRCTLSYYSVSALVFLASIPARAEGWYIVMFVQGGPEKTAQTLMRYNFSTAGHRVTRFPAKCSETYW